MMITLFVIFAILQLADGYTTIRGLKKPGTNEKNPLMAKLMARFGVTKAIVGTKLALLAVVLVFLPQMHVAAMLVLIAIYSYVVYRNWQVAK